jgi:hypothetical protein
LCYTTSFVDQQELGVQRVTPSEQQSALEDMELPYSFGVNALDFKFSGFGWCATRKTRGEVPMLKWGVFRQCMILAAKARSWLASPSASPEVAVQQLVVQCVTSSQQRSALEGMKLLNEIIPIRRTGTPLKASETHR